jgi:hypothetical protein
VNGRVEPSKLERRLAPPPAQPDDQAPNSDELDSPRIRNVPDVRLRPLLAASTNALVCGELERVERRHDVPSVPDAAPELAVKPGARLEPGRGHDDRIDERPLHAVVDGRFVALVDDADRNQQHACANVELARDQEVDVGLLELELTRLLETFHEGMLQLQLADEAKARGEAVVHD